MVKIITLNLDCLRIGASPVALRCNTTIQKELKSFIEKKSRCIQLEIENKKKEEEIGEKKTFRTVRCPWRTHHRNLKPQATRNQNSRCGIKTKPNPFSISIF
jgi:hypothetical protein